MKKIISLIMIAILTIFMVGCSSKNQTFYKNQLNIISDSNDVYVIALTNRDEISHYSMYKLKEYDEYGNFELFYKNELVKYFKNLNDSNVYWMNIHKLKENVLYSNSTNFVEIKYLNRLKKELKEDSVRRIKHRSLILQKIDKNN